MGRCPLSEYSLSSCIQGIGQLLRVTSSSIETLDTLNCDVIQSYPFSDILDYHALALSADWYVAFRLECSHVGLCAGGTKFTERGFCYAGPAAWKRKGKGNEEYLYSAFLHQGTHKALRHGSHSFTCKQHHACLSFVAFTRCHHHSS